MKHMLLAIASLALASCLAADAPYTCYLRVGTQEAERKTDTSGGKGKKKGSSTKTKTLTSTTSWPVSVSLRGKDIPSSDAVKLKCYFFGKTDGVPEKLGERVLDVSLDDKGDFKTDVTSPEAKLVHTTATTKSGGRGGRGMGRRAPPAGQAARRAHPHREGPARRRRRSAVRPERARCADFHVARCFGIMVATIGRCTS